MLKSSVGQWLCSGAGPSKIFKNFQNFFKFWNDPALWIWAFKFKVFSLDKVRSKVLTIFFSGCAGLKKSFERKKVILVTIIIRWIVEVSAKERKSLKKFVHEKTFFQGPWKNNPCPDLSIRRKINKQQYIEWQKLFHGNVCNKKVCVENVCLLHFAIQIEDID